MKELSLKHGDMSADDEERAGAGGRKAEKIEILTERWKKTAKKRKDDRGGRRGRKNC